MIRAYILMEITAGHATDMVNLLKGRSEIKGVARVTGPYDVVATIEAVDLNAISETVNDYIHSLTGVIRTTTCVALG